MNNINHADASRFQIEESTLRELSPNEVDMVAGAQQSSLTPTPLITIGLYTATIV